MMNEIRVFREEGSVIAEAVGKESLLSIPGVICVNPRATLEKRRYRKIFQKKPVFLSDEYEAAVRTHLSGIAPFVLSMNGFSSLKEDDLARYGIRMGAYEEACAEILRHAIKALMHKFPAANLKLAHGASALFIDQVIDDVAREFSILPLGFSCPEYIFYVPDDEVPVFIAKDKEEYANRFVQSVDLLVCTGGREHALQHDILAACLYDKFLHLIDVLSMLSKTGNVPAAIILADGKRRVNNAPAAFGNRITYSMKKVVLDESSGDDWDNLLGHVSWVARRACRHTMPVGKVFQGAIVS